jgi:hypothetical protein
MHYFVASLFLSHKNRAANAPILIRQCADRWSKTQSEAGTFIAAYGMH